MQIREGEKGGKKPKILKDLDAPTTARAEAYGLMLATTIAVLFGILCLYSVTYTYAVYSESETVITGDPNQVTNTISSFKSNMKTLKYVIKQGIFALFGLGCIVGIIKLGYRRLANWSLFFLIGLVLMLILPVVPPFRKPINGAYRWLIIGPIQIQPAEFAKVILVLFWADFLSRRTVEMKERPLLRVILPYGLFTLLVIGLTFLGKDLGTTILLCLVCYAVLVVAGCPWWVTYPIPALGILFIATLPIPFVLDFWSKIGLLPPYRIARLMSYRNPELYAGKEGYQLWLSELALGSGGWTGLGFSQSRMKYKYLPEAHTDCILSIVGEEMGFIMLILLMIVYCSIGFCGYRIAMKARTKLGLLIAFGMTTFILLQAVINMGVVCGALPTKGMPAPFISYGGSSLLTCLVAIGFILSVAWDNMHSQNEPNKMLEFKGRK